MDPSTETILAGANPDGVLELHAHGTCLTPQEAAAVVEAGAMPADLSAPSQPGDRLRELATRARQAVTDGDLRRLLAVLDAVELHAGRIDTEIHQLRAAKDPVRERAAAALVLPGDTVDAGEWSIVTCRRAVEDGLREWLADVCPELLEGLDWPGGANELIDRIKEQAK